VSAYETIRKGIKLRNEIAHQGVKRPNEEVVIGLLEAAKDVIWLLEWCKGFGWAWQFISGETQKEYVAELCGSSIDQAEGLTPKEKKDIKKVLPAAFLLKPKETERAAELLNKFKEKLPSKAIHYLRRSAAKPVKTKLGLAPP
jgi:hypothetical protein